MADLTKLEKTSPIQLTRFRITYRTRLDVQSVYMSTEICTASHTADALRSQCNIKCYQRFMKQYSHFPKRHTLAEKRTVQTTTHSTRSQHSQGTSCCASRVSWVSPSSSFGQQSVKERHRISRNTVLCSAAV